MNRKKEILLFLFLKLSTLAAEDLTDPKKQKNALNELNLMILAADKTPGAVYYPQSLNVDKRVLSPGLESSPYWNGDTSSSYQPVGTNAENGYLLQDFGGLNYYPYNINNYDTFPSNMNKYENIPNIYDSFPYTSNNYKNVQNIYDSVPYTINNFKNIPYIQDSVPSNYHSNYPKSFIISPSQTEYNPTGFQQWWPGLIGNINKVKEEEFQPNPFYVGKNDLTYKPKHFSGTNNVKDRNVKNENILDIVKTNKEKTATKEKELKNYVNVLEEVKNKQKCLLDYDGDDQMQETTNL